VRLIAIAACALVAIAASAAVIVRHEGARDAYAQEAARFGSDGYSAARSDARYADVRARAVEADRTGWGIAALVIAIALIAGAPSPTARSASASLAWMGPVIDTIGIAAVVALAAVLARALGAEHSASGAIVMGGAYGVAIGAPWSAIARGATPGMRVVGVAIDEPPGIVRGGLALLLALALVPIAPIAALLARKQSGAPAYLRWVGLGLAPAGEDSSGRPG
jgi:hypothetical protein